MNRYRVTTGIKCADRTPLHALRCTLLIHVTSRTTPLKTNAERVIFRLAFWRRISINLSSPISSPSSLSRTASSVPTGICNMATDLQQDKIEAEAHHLLNGSGTAVNAWSSPGPSAFDFRSSPALSHTRSSGKPLTLLKATQ